MEEGAIVEWFKSEGDPVKRGEVLFTVESDKATLEVESTNRGFLRRILIPAGQPVPVLTVVGLMTRQLDEALDDYQATPAMEHDLSPASAAELSPASQAPSPQRERIFSSPRARKLAREQGVDISQVSGSGPNGRIVEQDVRAYLDSIPKATPLAVKTAVDRGVDLKQVVGTGVSGRIMQRDLISATPPGPAPAPSAAAAAATIQMSGLRGIIAERMAASVHTTARVTLVTEVDATNFVAARESLKASVSEEWGFAPGYNDLLAAIVVRALGEYPYMNARLNEDGSAIEQIPMINLGMAVDTERGLLVPVIHDAGQKGLRAFGTEFRELTARARAGRSLPDDLAGGTFTITNLGMYGVDAFTPVINMPELAILGAGRIQSKPAVLNDEVVVRQMWTLSLVFDHRLVDGAPAARFLQRITQLVENPYLLLG
jgi:pyruvate dehydrogenase E2 component (dihydrolipoamide acetyltransferase)